MVLPPADRRKQQSTGLLCSIVRVSSFGYNIKRVIPNGITLVNEGETILVDTTSVVTINAHRADGAAGAFAGDVNSDGTVTVPLTNWMLELDDTVKCDITVVDGEP